MRIRPGLIAFLVFVFVLAALAPPSGAQTTRTLTVTPDSGLVSGDVVLIEGSGFTPGATVGACQVVVAGTLGQEDCGPIIGTFITDESGSFSTTFAVRRFITVGTTTIDCASVACGIGAADLADIPGTAILTPISFAPVSGTPRPDLIFKRRDTGQLLEDNQYFAFPTAAPRHSHLIVPGGKWTYALRVQNDGDVVDDLTVTGGGLLVPPFAVRFFVGYFDVTALVTGGGFTFEDVSPGSVLPLGVQFRADETATLESNTVVVQVTSGGAPELVDFTRLRVTVTTGGD